MSNLVKEIDALLPQTQCGQCGYNGCLPYAQAIAKGAAINQCPPGGMNTLKALASLLNQDAEKWITESTPKKQVIQVAIIQESYCIGCTKCIQACPVDAIIGAAKQMHTILKQECTGCGLCIDPCPVDCIELKETPDTLYQPTKARQRFNAKKQRLEKKRQKISAPMLTDSDSQQNYIAQAVMRVKAKKVKN